MLPTQIPTQSAAYVSTETHVYGLVQAYHPTFRRPRTPHAMVTRMSHIWYHADRHEEWKTVTDPVMLQRT